MNGKKNRHHSFCVFFKPRGAVINISLAADPACPPLAFRSSSPDRFPASRGLSRRGKMKRQERDLCRLPTICLMKSPTKFLVETYRFSKPVSFNVYCACLVRLYADNYKAHGRLLLPRDLRVSKFLTLIDCFHALR